MTESKIIFLNDSIDPWNTLEVIKDVSADLPDVFIEGNAIINIQRDTK